MKILILLLAFVLNACTLKAEVLEPKIIAISESSVTVEHRSDATLPQIVKQAYEGCAIYGKYFRHVSTVDVGRGAYKNTIFACIGTLPEPFKSEK